MDIKWIVLILFNKFIFVCCDNCLADKVKYLAKIEIKWDEELIHSGIGSLIHPDYVLTAGSFISDYYKFHNIDSKYPSMTITFDNSDLKNEHVFKVREIIIMPKLYDPLSTDFALLALETRPNIPLGYTRSLYRKKEKIIASSEHYYLGTWRGLIKLQPVDREISSLFIDTRSHDDGDVLDYEVGAPLFFCDETRQQFIQVGIFSCFSSSKQRHSNLMLLAAPIFEFIADRAFSKCSMHQRINDGQARFHNRAYLGDSIVNVHASIYPNKTTIKKFRCSGSFFDEKHIVSSANCLFEYNEERKNSLVTPELYDKNNTKYKLTLDIGIVDQVNRPHIVMSEKHIRSVQLHPNYIRKEGKADLALIEITRDVNKFTKGSKFSIKLRFECLLICCELFQIIIFP